MAPTRSPRIAAARGGPGQTIAKVLVLFGSLLMISRAFWAPYWIPAGSMEPTLMSGDYLIVGRSLPPEPKRGDVLVFRHPVSHDYFIKRLIGLPGDQVQMKNGALHLNGGAVQAVPDGVLVAPKGMMQRCVNDPVAPGGACEREKFVETLPGGHSYTTLNTGMGPTDNTAVFTVPEGHYFFMGDNRDNSTDSRMNQLAGGVGFVPAENLTGQADRVMFSSAGRSLFHVWTWRADRFFKRIE
ncbi:MAG: signal peptidase I [Tropicimonas sp.]|uniref:signal peptidase I n=1 Tax=Tropicimonas sp. TaxID=2067044 RepID=UPI003A8679AA